MRCSHETPTEYANNNVGKRCRVWTISMYTDAVAHIQTQSFHPVPIHKRVRPIISTAGRVHAIEKSLLHRVPIVVKSTTINVSVARRQKHIILDISDTHTHTFSNTHTHTVDTGCRSEAPKQLTTQNRHRMRAPIYRVYVKDCAPNGWAARKWRISCACIQLAMASRIEPKAKCHPTETAVVMWRTHHQAKNAFIYIYVYGENEKYASSVAEDILWSEFLYFLRLLYTASLRDRPDASAYGLLAPIQKCPHTKFNRFSFISRRSFFHFIFHSFIQNFMYANY